MSYVKKHTLLIISALFIYTSTVQCKHIYAGYKKNRKLYVRNILL
ncbi:hypothetical protein SerAS12_3894 [Serratia sp. AS12]|nr:hypothetical protein SerAS9_3893 [Serratia plymuthica AS9]AEF51946.1 hypothetical protein SerAS12_3894 [Serratia sp. AS12]AEG29653.1 hypothetical protein SerAS13_3894 [Serratia sp. AS13]